MDTQKVISGNVLDKSEKRAIKPSSNSENLTHLLLHIHRGWMGWDIIFSSIKLILLPNILHLSFYHFIIIKSYLLSTDY